MRGAGNVQFGQSSSLCSKGDAHAGDPPSRMEKQIRSASKLPPMSDPLIRACDDYVVLEPGKPEQLLDVPNTLAWLSRWLQTMDQLPADLADLSSVEAAAQRLLDTACDLELSPGVSIQWFAVRLEPPS